MTRRKLFLLFFTLSFLILAGCGKSADKTKDEKVITIAASPTPHAEILEHVVPILKKEGYELKITKLDDFIIPNKALASGEVTANFFQHVPFFRKAVKENNYHFAIAGSVHIEPIGLYSKKLKNIKNLKNGATIIVSESVADWGRILTILQKANLIKVKSGIDIKNATFDDIFENKKHLKVVYNLKPEMLVPAYKNQEGDLVAINANFAYGAGLNPTKDALLLEADNSPYDNIVAVTKGQEKAPKIKALMKALHEKKVQDWILKKWNGSVKPVTNDAWHKH